MPENLIRKFDSSGISITKGEEKMFKTIALIITSVSLAASATVQAQNEDKTTAPTDAEIAQIVLTADTIDINYGKLAEKKSNNEEVKEFAKTMIRDHSSVNRACPKTATRFPPGS